MDSQIYAIYDWLAYNENKESAPAQEQGDEIFLINTSVFSYVTLLENEKIFERDSLCLLFYFVKYEMGEMELGNWQMERTIFNFGFEIFLKNI